MQKFNFLNVLKQSLKPTRFFVMLKKVYSRFFSYEGSLSKDQNLKQGDRIGMIRFGSRVDLFFKNKKILTKIGQNVVAGESLLAKE